MASKQEVKEHIKNYILENYVKLSEQDEDGDGIDDEIDAVVDEPTEEDPAAGEDAFKAVIDLLNSAGERVGSILRQVKSKEEKVDILNRMVDFVLSNFTTREDLPNSMLRDFFIRKFGGSENDEAPMEEMSTSGATGAYNTKYAFRRKK